MAACQIMPGRFFSLFITSTASNHHMNSNEYNNEVTVVVMRQKNAVVNDLHISWIMCKTALVVCFIEQIYNACNELIKRGVSRAL